MKKNIHFCSFSIIVLLSGLILFGCSKTDEPQKKADSSSLQQLSQDDNNMEQVSDEALNDANILMSLTNLKSTTNDWPCDATIDSTAVVNDTITYFITYNGLNCTGTLYRTGRLEVQKKVGTHWYQAGTTVIVRYVNLHFTRIVNGKSMTINGRKIFKNVSGGLLFLLGSQLTYVVYRTQGYMYITFDDQTIKTWNIARQHVFTGTLGNLVLSIDGFGSASGYTNLVAWGSSRNGEAFFLSINQSIVIKEACQWKPSSGIKQIKIPGDNKGATVTFGYDNNNQPVLGDECPTKFRVDWYKNQQSGTIFLWLFSIK